ncbi:Alkaline ceramidase 3 [Erysiphe neolycopersici]|uniref:Alkaline ceramidase 3 n=1 Tax=Erysiphe neolycopersici TaxID=212602 RepID=A0A420HSB0_9PEZI|nr:Alkaline ceramidase 3 [Erysiphe neolycopersici]
MQLVDELSMIYTVCFMCYATFSFERPKIFRQILGTSLLFLSLSITLSYYYLQIPAFHQVAFGVLLTIVVFRSLYVMEFRIRKSLHERYALAFKKESMSLVSSDQLRDLRKDMNLLNKMWLMVGFGLSIFLGGFALWNLDNRYCSTLRYWRHRIGLPWGILLEGHGWWYVIYDH